MSALPVVWSIPLADRGFDAIGPSNLVRWYVEEYETGRLVDGRPHSTREAADSAARAAGYRVTQGAASEGAAR